MDTERLFGRRPFRPRMRRWIPDPKLLWAECIEDVTSCDAICAEDDDPIVVTGRHHDQRLAGAVREVLGMEGPPHPGASPTVAAS